MKDEEGIYSGKISDLRKECDKWKKQTENYEKMISVL